jgi:hypothetical protein
MRSGQGILGVYQYDIHMLHAAGVVVLNKSTKAGEKEREIDTSGGNGGFRPSLGLRGPLSCS